MNDIPDRVRVLVVDDSAFARKVLRQALEASPRLDVVGTARDGLDALEKIADLQPDVATLDLMMPGLDGIGVLRELAALKSSVRVLVVSISDEDSELALEALLLGAVDLVKKPTALATDRLQEISGELVEKVLTAAGATRSLAVAPAERGSLPLAGPTHKRVEMLVVGTSTGGPQALAHLLAGLPADFPVPIAIGLHIPADYTRGLASRLSRGSALEVVEAHDGLQLRPGLVALARGGAHLRLERRGGSTVARVSDRAEGAVYVPSVDFLFQSAAAAFGAATLGVILTGMGDDGLAGSRAIVAAGGRVLTESESSCVVYGMPRSIKEAGLSAAEAAIDAMPAEIIRWL